MNYESTISHRIKQVSKGNVSDFSRKSGLGESLLRQYIGGATPGLEKAVAIAKAAGVSLEWLATGEGEPLTGSAREKPENKDIDSQLKKIECQLQELDAPFSPDRVAKERVIYNIQQQLSNISSASAATQVQRARADKMLELAFEDAGAIQRMSQRMDDVGVRLRHSSQAFNQILAALDWEPSPFIKEVVKTSIYNGLSNDGAVMLMNMLRLQFEDDNKK